MEKNDSTDPKLNIKLIYVNYNILSSCFLFSLYCFLFYLLVFLLQTLFHRRQMLEKRRRRGWELIEGGLGGSQKIQEYKRVDF